MALVAVAVPVAAEVAAARLTGLAAAAGGSSTTFLGRPLGRAVFMAGVSLSSFSSARVFLLVAVALVAVLLVVFDAAFAFDAVVAPVAVEAVGFPAFAAARARVIRLGGDWTSMMGRFDGLLCGLVCCDGKEEGNTKSKKGVGEYSWHDRGKHVPLHHTVIEPKRGKIDE